MVFSIIASSFAQNLPPFLLLDGLFGDLTFVLKIFVLMAIFAYVTGHVGKGPLGIFVFAVIAWLVIFDYFAIFGSLYILYMLLAMGLTGVIIDFMFITPAPHPKAEGPSGDPISNGKDFMERQAHYQAMLGQGKGRR